ncbi:replication factor A2 [Raphidocelis subcapitata]|uniref:Replication factor A2 n=1 Tax=Raphidocelis subcapitata TaxID=307507 RepID=A0A2V0NPA7_9CHLO|nr:replication factor A2 [Raphidocelis subcapitata]|eukprot:GBF88362.1 replication factor A2 [Raphidocelis subcapitata]
MAMFDAHQFAGGGFMPTQQPDQGMGASGKGGRHNEQTLRAVTVRQMVTALDAAGPDQDLVIDGAELSNVTLVGKVVSAEESGGGINLAVSDSTGTVDVRAYVDGGDQQSMAQKLAEWQPGTYVRVYGHVRPFGGGRNVQSFAVRAVHDFNEVTYHCLQTIFQHIHLAKGSPAGGAAGAVKQEAGFGAFAAAGGWPQQQQFGAAAGAPAAAAPPGMEPCQAAVLKIISDPTAGEGGVHVNDVCSRLAPQGYTRQRVEAALYALQNEAHAFTTSDDSHWKGTA